LIQIYTSLLAIGTIITRDGYDYKEINRRLSIGRMAMTKLEKIMKNRDVTDATKIKIAETTIFPIVTYRIDNWTVRKKERKKIDAFKLWTWRRILRVPWTERKTKLSVSEAVKPERSLEATILLLTLRYFGHVMNLGDALFIKFIKNQGLLHVSTIICSS
jgi:hypothetical protein